MPEAGKTMVRKPRRNHPPAFKAKVALAAIRGEQMIVARLIRWRYLSTAACPDPGHLSFAEGMLGRSCAGPPARRSGRRLRKIEDVRRTGKRPRPHRTGASEGCARTSSGRREGRKPASGRAQIRSWVGRGKNRKVRREAVKAYFFNGRQRPWARLPIGLIFALS